MAEPPFSRAVHRAGPRYTARVVEDAGRLGARLRRERERQRIGLRELSRRLGVSPSLISQIETGKSSPSVATLYLIVNELGLSLDELLFDGHHGATRRAPSEPRPVQRSSERQSITLASGVRWERLTNGHEAVDFLEVEYAPGAESAPPEALIRHSGREYGVVLSGQLGVQLGFEEQMLQPGDSIAFDSTVPHRLWAVGDEPVRAIWFVVGRRGDSRLTSGPETMFSAW